MAGPAVADDEDDDGSCWEQVMVAAFPGGPSPQVFLVNLQALNGTISFREANVAEGEAGSLSLGSERIVDLRKAVAVVDRENALAVVGQDRTPLVLLYLDTAEELSTWKEALQLVIGLRESAPEVSKSGAPPSAAEESEDDEINMLRARSQQQQTRIGQLEALHKRRDTQLSTLLQRLDGAMQMLDAVQDMCTQQRKVIETQRVAITALSEECGLGDEDEDAPPAAAAPAAEAGLKAPPTQANGSDEASVEEVEAEMAAKAEQMMSLLKQADEMQRALSQLEASGLLNELGEAPSSQESSPERQPAAEAEQDEDPAAVLERLEALEAEKARLASMLSSSRNEQEELLQQLAGMRSVLSAAGVDMSEEDSP